MQLTNLWETTEYDVYLFYRCAVKCANINICSTCRSDNPAPRISISSAHKNVY